MLMIQTEDSFTEFLFGGFIIVVHPNGLSTFHSLKTGQKFEIDGFNNTQ